MNIAQPKEFVNLSTVSSLTVIEKMTTIMQI